MALGPDPAPKAPRLTPDPYPSSRFKPTPDPEPKRSPGQLAYVRRQLVLRDLARQKSGKGTSKTAASLKRYQQYLPKATQVGKVGK